MTKFATESFTDTVIQKDICVIAPFLFQQNSSISTKIHSIKNLNKLIIDNIEKIIQDETSIDFKILENNFLVLSLATWSLIMMNHDTSDGFESLCNKLNYLEKIRRKGISNKSFPVIQIDKSLNHLLRTVNLCMIQSLKHKDKNEILKPIENIFDLLKNQLSSPYHQVIKYLSLFNYIIQHLMSSDKSLVLQTLAIEGMYLNRVFMQLQWTLTSC